jgi:hypothetical protein
MVKNFGWGRGEGVGFLGFSVEVGTSEYPFFLKEKIGKLLKLVPRKEKPTGRRPMHVERGRL